MPPSMGSNRHDRRLWALLNWCLVPERWFVTSGCLWVLWWCWNQSRLDNMFRVWQAHMFEYIHIVCIYIYFSNARIFSSMVVCLNLEYITLHLWKRTHMHASLKWFQCWFDLDDELLRALDAIDSTKECHINENKPIVVEYTYVHIPIDHYRSIYLPIHLPNRYIFTCPIHTYMHACMHAYIHTYRHTDIHIYI